MDKRELWTSILLRMRGKIPHAQFITWFKKSAILRIDQGLLILGVGLPMSLDWIDRHFRDDLLKTIQEIEPTTKTLNIQVDATLMREGDPRLSPEEIFANRDSNKGRKKPRRAEVLLSEGLTTKILDRAYSLENFVVGSENRLAHAACLAVSASPGKHYNPLFIWGATGLGKTHLLQGAGNEILKRSPHKLVIYTTSEAFGNDYIMALQRRKMDQFNNRYRKIDVLIIDDIQFLSGKNKTEETFSTRSTLYMTRASKSSSRRIVRQKN